MDDRDIGRIWAGYYPKTADNRDALQRVLDACEISKAESDEVEKKRPCNLNLA